MLLGEDKSLRDLHSLRERSRGDLEGSRQSSQWLLKLRKRGGLVITHPRTEADVGHFGSIWIVSRSPLCGKVLEFQCALKRSNNAARTQRFRRLLSSPERREERRLSPSAQGRTSSCSTRPQTEKCLIFSARSTRRCPLVRQNTPSICFRRTATGATS